MEDDSGPGPVEVGAGSGIGITVDVARPELELPAGSAVLVASATAEVMTEVSPFESLPLEVGNAVTHASC